jgi:hypothetical protein
MKILSRRSLDGGLLGEWLLMFGVLASVGWVVSFFFTHHYLPQPFVFDTADTFMDWFNTAKYAHRPGAYDIWHSVYLPLSFVFLRLFTIPACYGDPFNARDCDWLGQTSIVALYALDCIVAFLLLRRADRATAIPRGVAFALGFPLLFCLERGNLILAALPAFMIAYSTTTRSRFGRVLAIAVTINLKQYLVVSAFALAVKRDWRTLELAGLCSLGVYLLTMAWFGSGDPFQLVENMGIFSGLADIMFYQFSYYSTSYSTLLTIGGDGLVNATDVMSSRLVDSLMFGIPLLIHVTQAIGLTAIVAIWLQPEAVPLPRVTALFTGLYMVTSSPTGYAFSFFVFLIFLERDRRVGPSIALLCTYIQSISYDIQLVTVFSYDRISWLSGLAVPENFGLAVGQLVRPGLLIVTVWALAYDSITQSILAHRRRRPSLGLMPA